MLEQVLFFTILTAFLITVLLSPLFIPFLRQLKFGQSIRDEGPKISSKETRDSDDGWVNYHSFCDCYNTCDDREIHKARL